MWSGVQALGFLGFGLWGYQAKGFGVEGFRVAGCRVAGCWGLVGVGFFSVVGFLTEPWTFDLASLLSIP